MRFYPALDNALLKEVLSLDPWINKAEWPVVAQHINDIIHSSHPDMKVTERCCRDRLKTLLKAFKKEEMESLRASGTDEEYTERGQLLKEVLEITEDHQQASLSSKSQTDTAAVLKEAQGVEVRRAALETLKRSKDADTSFESHTRAKRRSMDGVLSYLQEKSTQDMKIKSEQLALEREKFELDKKEREQRMKTDAKMLELLQSLIKKTE